MRNPVIGWNVRPRAIVRQRRSPASTNLRRDPSGAHLVARKRRPIHDDDVEAGPPERPRAGGPGRPAADDQHVTRVHTCPRSGASR